MKRLFSNRVMNILCRALQGMGAIILGFFVVSLLLPVPTQAYVTDRFVCDISGSTVTVALVTENSDLDSCFAMLNALETEIVLIQGNIDRAKDLISQSRQVVYRTETLTTLETQRDLYKRSQTQLIDAITDFERELFIRIKTITYVTLNQERTNIRTSLDQTQRLLKQLERKGDTAQYILVRGVFSKLKTQGFYLEAVQQSNDFSELLPALKVYFSVQGPLL